MEQDTAWFDATRHIFLINQVFNKTIASFTPKQLTALIKEDSFLHIPAHKIALTSRNYVSEDELRAVFAYLTPRDIMLHTSRVNKSWRLICACELVQRCFSPTLSLVLNNSASVASKTTLKSMNEYFMITKKLDDFAIIGLINLLKAAHPMIYVQQQLVLQQSLNTTLSNLTNYALARDAAQTYPLFEQTQAIPLEKILASSPAHHSPSNSLTSTPSMANITVSTTPSTPTKEQQASSHTIVYIFKDCFRVTDVGMQYLCTQSPMPISVLKLYGCWRITDV